MFTIHIYAKKECLLGHLTSLCAVVSYGKRELLFSLAGARQLLDTEVGAQVLGARTVGVCQVLSVDSEAVSGVADAVTLS
jgi:hypothetical protein